MFLEKIYQKSHNILKIISLEVSVWTSVLVTLSVNKCVFISVVEFTPYPGSFTVVSL